MECGDERDRKPADSRFHLGTRVKAWKTEPVRSGCGELKQAHGDPPFRQIRHVNICSVQAGAGNYTFPDPSVVRTNLFPGYNNSTKKFY
jgi:hypothetical protein